MVHSTFRNKRKQHYFFSNTTVGLFSPPYFKYNTKCLEHVKIAGIKTALVKKPTKKQPEHSCL